MYTISSPFYHCYLQSLYFSDRLSPKVTLTFHYDDKTYHDVNIDEQVRAADVVRFLVLKNQAKEDKNWVVVEQVGKLNLGEWVC